jgi:hypothetical protein
VAHSHDDGSISQPEVLTLHWEGPAGAEFPPEHRFPGSQEESRAAREAEREQELRDLSRTRQGREIWEQIRGEASSRGDGELWRRKLHAYWWVKMKAGGNAGDYARRFDANHATVRTWIAEVAKLGYQVGFRLHEDRLVLVGEAPTELKRLRELVNADAGSAEATAELCRVASRFRGEEPYFHLNEGHVLRAQGRLRESEETLREGLTVAEARLVRSLLWNARGQTFWDCTAASSFPLGDHLERAEKAFRRAVVLDQSIYFPFVNLAQLALEAGDERRCEYWIGELSGVRRRMTDEMNSALVRYLSEAEWSRPVESARFWKGGPVKWIREAVRRGVLAGVAVVLLIGVLAAPAAYSAPTTPFPETVERDNNGGTGGN